MPYPSHDCVVSYEPGQSVAYRGERLLQAVAYRAGRCRVCGKPHVFIPASASEDAAREIRRHVAWWYGTDRTHPNSVRVYRG